MHLLATLVEVQQKNALHKNSHSDRYPALAKLWQPIYLLHLARRALNNCEHYDCLTLLRSANSDSDD